MYKSRPNGDKGKSIVSTDKVEKNDKAVREIIETVIRFIKKKKREGSIV